MVTHRRIAITPTDFCYWLQGYFEIGGFGNETLDHSQVSVIRNHLNLVFQHSIDPQSAVTSKMEGSLAEKMHNLQQTHDGKGEVARC